MSPEQQAAARDAELAPCPFCGSANVDPGGWASTNSRGPACDDCGASAGSPTGLPHDNIAAWNRRATLPPAAPGEITHDQARAYSALYSTAERIVSNLRRGPGGHFMVLTVDLECLDQAVLKARAALAGVPRA